MIWFIMNFAARTLLFAFIIHKHGFKAALIAWVYAILTALSPEL